MPKLAALAVGRLTWGLVIWRLAWGPAGLLAFARGVNALWSRGGVMYPLSMQ